MGVSNRMEARRLDIVESVVSQVEETLKQRGFDPEDALRVAVSVADNLFENFGGQNITIPKNYKAKLAQKEELIYGQFNGSNLSQLAMIHKISERGLRKLLVRAGIRLKASKQAELPHVSPASKA